MLEALGNIGDFLGGIGVVITLIYLATQIRENTQSLGAASLQSVLDGFRDRFLLPHGSNGETSEIFSKGLTSLDLLDENEKRRFWYMMVEVYFHMQHVMHLQERGLIPQVDYDAWLKWTVALTRTRGGGEMWLQIQTLITPTIAELVNKQLEFDHDTPSVFEVMPVFEHRASRASTP